MAHLRAQLFSTRDDKLKTTYDYDTFNFAQRFV